MVTLCSVVAYTEHVFHSKYGDVRLECGQMVTSYRSLAECLGVGVRQVRTLLQLLKNEGIISIEAVQKEATQEATQQMTQYSILTINDLHESATQQATQEATQDIEGINKKDSLKEKINNKKESSISTKKKFVPPTAEEVQEYLDSKGITFFTGREFVDYYEQGGWVYGTNHTPIRNWKACVTTWLKHKNQNPTGNGNSPTNIYTNGIAGREERMQRLQRDIFEHLAHPDPPADELFDF